MDFTAAAVRTVNKAGPNGLSINDVAALFSLCKNAGWAKLTNETALQAGSAAQYMVRQFYAKRDNNMLYLFAL